MNATFHWLLWRTWGFIRIKTNDTDEDCPCCGLSLPWPQRACMRPEESGTKRQPSGETVYWQRGVRQCPRCRTQWHVEVITSQNECSMRRLPDQGSGLSPESQPPKSQKIVEVLHLSSPSAERSCDQPQSEQTLPKPNVEDIAPIS